MKMAVFSRRMAVAFALTAVSRAQVFDAIAQRAFAPVNGNVYAPYQGSTGLEFPVVLGTNWAIARYDPSSPVLETLFVSPEHIPTGGQYAEYVRSIAVGDVLGDANPEVVATYGDGVVAVHDARTHAQVLTFQTSNGYVFLHDLDADGKAEILVVGFSNLNVFTGAGALSWSFSGTVGDALVVGQFDGDPALEIVTEGGLVFDAGTHALQWSNPSGGGWPAAADIDNDGKLEWLSGRNADLVRAFDVDTQSLKWSFPAGPLLCMAVDDIEGDGIEELFIGLDGAAEVRVYDTATRNELGSIQGSSGYGVNRVLTSDVDLDGELEVLFSTGASTTAAKNVHVAHAATRAIEWQSTYLSGPFAGPVRGDLDGDGSEEIAVVSQRAGSDGERILVLDPATLTLRAMSQPIADNLNSYDYKSIELAEIDGDNAREIVVGTERSTNGRAEIYDFTAPSTFTRVWTNASMPIGTAFTAVRVVDVDGDSNQEVVCASSAVSTACPGPCVYVYDLATRGLEWRSPALGASGFQGRMNTLIVDDLDGDGRVEIVVLRDNENVYVVDPTSHGIAGVLPGPFSSLDESPIGQPNAVRCLMTGDASGVLRRHFWSGGSFTTTAGTPTAPSRVDVLEWNSRRFTYLHSNGRVERYRGLTSNLSWSTAPYGFWLGTRILVAPTSNLQVISVGASAVLGF